MNISTFDALTLNSKGKSGGSRLPASRDFDNRGSCHLNDFENINILKDSNALFNDSMFRKRGGDQHSLGGSVRPLFQNMNLFNFEPNETITRNIFGQETTNKGLKRVKEKTRGYPFEAKEMSVPKRFIDDLTPEIFSSKIAPQQPAPSAPENESFMYFYNNNTPGNKGSNQNLNSQIAGNNGGLRKTPVRQQPQMTHDFSFDQARQSIFPEAVNKSMADLESVPEPVQNGYGKMHCPSIDFSRNPAVKEVTDVQISPIFNFSGKMLHSPPNQSRSKFISG